MTKGDRQKSLLQTNASPGAMQIVPGLFVFWRERIG
jgi:hypothetical protein